MAFENILPDLAQVKPEDAPPSMLDAAIAYAAVGYRVFPCRAKDRPLVKWGKQATTDPATITRWWRRWPDALIGAATGRGFAVLDIDLRDDRNGFATLIGLGVTAL